MNDVVASHTGNVASLWPTGLRCCVMCGALYRTDFNRCPTDGGLIREVDRDPLLGAVLNDTYIIEDVLGEGSTGRVYRANHSRLVNKQYAVKVLVGDVAASQVMRLRFAQEAETASKLVHPNVVGVVDVGRNASGLLYLAMELVEGPTVAQLIANGVLPARRVIELACQIADGLAHAHAHGLVHRDLKPENIVIVTVAGQAVPRILDFGLAISVAPENSRLTGEGLAVGTPAYAAPEQATGKEVDHRADLYALGATMYEMLCGRVPFDGDASETMLLKVTQEPPTLTERAPHIDVPPDLEQVVMTLLARVPADRFASAREVSAILHEMIRADVSEALSSVTLTALRKSEPHIQGYGGRSLGSTPKIVLPPLEPLYDTGAVAPAPNTQQRRLLWLGLAVAGVAVTVLLALRLRPSEPAAAAATPAALLATPPTPTPTPMGEPTLARVIAPSATPTTPALPKARLETEPPTQRNVPQRMVLPAKKNPNLAKTAPPLMPTHASADTTERESQPPVVVVQPQAELPPPPPAVPPSPPAQTTINPITTRRSYVPHIKGLVVDGSLPSSDVERALQRVTPALRDCVAKANAPGVIRVGLQIDESRRASNVHVDKQTSVAVCVANAVSALRSAVAPDVGDVAVSFTVEVLEQK